MAKNRKEIKDSYKKGEKEITSKSSKRTDTTFYVTIEYITDIGSVLTSGGPNFEKGILYPNNILYKNKPIPVDLCKAQVEHCMRPNSNLKVKLLKTSIINEITVGILTFDLAGMNNEDDQVFQSMEVGRLYKVTVFDINPEYITVRVPETSIRGYIEKSAFPNVKLGNELELILSRKGINTFQFLQFVKEYDGEERVNTEREVDADSLYENLFDYEKPYISEQDEKWIKRNLLIYPHLKKDSLFLEDIKHIYCRYSAHQSFALKQFYSLHPNYFAQNNFYISYDEEDDSIILFNADYVVMKMVIRNDMTLWLKEFFFDQTDIQAKRICDKYQYNKLLIEGHKIHILDSYNAVPHTFDLESILNYLIFMNEFHYEFKKELNDKLIEKKKKDTEDFEVLKTLLYYEKELELKKKGERIYVSSQSEIRPTTPQEYLKGTAYTFILSKGDYNKLAGILDEGEELFVSIVDPEKGDKPLRSGKMMYDEQKGTAIIEFIEGKDIDPDRIKNGFHLLKRASVEHYNIQIEAINSLSWKNDSLYHKILLDKDKTPDIEPYNSFCDYYDSKIKQAAKGNNQPLAVKKALGNKGVLLIQGPPGTGKTTVIIEIIRQLVDQGKKVLVCSQAHAAVDNIVKKLEPIKDKISFIAVDNEGEENSSGKEFDKEEYKLFLANNIDLIEALGRNMEVNEDYIDETYQYKTKMKDKYLSFHNYVAKYYKEYVPLYKNAKEILSCLIQKCELNGRLLDSYRYQMQDVILGTCIGIGMNRTVRNLHFDTVIIDEAAKANLAESLVPMRLADRYILVGDDKQLPPYTDRVLISNFVNDYNEHAEVINISNEKVVSTISKSLFEFYHDLLPENSENIVMLNYQYRMHPEIGKFVSTVFYDGEVNMGENTISQYLELPEPYDNPIVFVDSNPNKHTFEKRSNQSFYNENEAQIICKQILPTIIKSGANEKYTLAIITPYSAQRDYLKRMIESPYLKNNVYTIDSIQGMEFDIVIFSFVRSFPEKSDKVVGFLDDMRRLNVSLSRAKKKLILVGDKQTLTREKSHRDSSTTISPVEVFEKLTDENIIFGNPSRHRLFYDYYHVGDRIPCKVENVLDDYLTFRTQDDLILKFRLRDSAWKLLFLQDSNQIEVEIENFDKNANPIFKIVRFMKDGITYDYFNKFEFEVINKTEDNWVDVRFSNQMKARYKASNYFYWRALVIGNKYNQFLPDKHGELNIWFDRQLMKTFLDNHNEGDFVQGSIAYKSSNTCIAWCENVIGKVINANERRISINALCKLRIYSIDHYKNNVEFEII